MSSLQKHIILKKKEDRRVLAGHPWVFSNEIQEIKGSPVSGDIVELIGAGGRSLGIGFYNAHSLIAFRLLSAQITEIDHEFFRMRITAALALRRKLYPDGSTFRLIHGESDFLPGLVVDKFNEYLCVQTFSFGMDVRLPMICDVLEEVVKPTGIVERNESSLRTLEQLPQKQSILRGTADQTTLVEHGIQYRIDPLKGQKTGFFLDQRDNRASIRQFSNGVEVLDCFCNDGGFALNAALAGASTVTGIDASEEACKRARENARLNGLRGPVFEHADVFEKLKQLHEQGRKYDVIVLDPPSFARNKKTVPAARRGYRDLHIAALDVLRVGGFLLTASCSHHIEPDVFLDIVDESVRKVGRRLQLLEWRGAAPDHPVLPRVPETRYLTFAVCRIC
jgi:23S rRNA (cytosine1962-C5)-methyltransferase